MKITRNILIIIIVVLSITYFFIHKTEGIIVDKWETDYSYVVMFPSTIISDNAHKYGITIEYEHLFGIETRFFYIEKERFDTLKINDNFNW